MTEDHKINRHLLVERVNSSIQQANLKRARKGLPLGMNVTMKHINRVVAIARRPGPDMNFKAGELNDLLIKAGFKTK